MQSSHQITQLIYMWQILAFNMIKIPDLERKYYSQRDPNKIYRLQMKFFKLQTHPLNKYHLLCLIIQPQLVLFDQKKSKNMIKFMNLMMHKLFTLMIQMMARKKKRNQRRKKKKLKMENKLKRSYLQSMTENPFLTMNLMNKLYLKSISSTVLVIGSDTYLNTQKIWYKDSLTVHTLFLVSLREKTIKNQNK